MEKRFVGKEVAVDTGRGDRRGRGVRVVSMHYVPGGNSQRANVIDKKSKIKTPL